MYLFSLIQVAKSPAPLWESIHSLDDPIISIILKNTPTEELGQEWQEFIKFEIVLKSYRKSSQIWNLCSGNKYPLKFLLVVHIVYSLTSRSNSEDKNRPVKNTDWKTLTGPVWEKRVTYSRSYLAIAFVHALKLRPKKRRKIV